MAWTQADIDRLQAVMASGAKETQFSSGDSSRKMVLHSVADMERLLASMRAEVASAARIRTAVVSYSRD